MNSSRYSHIVWCTGVNCLVHFVRLTHKFTKDILAEHLDMPPVSLEELLYRKLMSSPAFHAWVRRIHARINRIPLEEQPLEKGKRIFLEDYRPTQWHKANALRIIFWDELKKAFTFRR
ncbi:hypothetical protein CJI97_005281 [Candidozyma auris]|nr:hypothetical protein CJI97_005281 [[Candida] auris]